MEWLGGKGLKKYLRGIKMESQDSKIDNILSSKQGHLFVEGCDTTKLVKEFGSPLFVISEQQLRDNFKRYKTAFMKHWPHGPVDILPASKANWNTAIRSLLSEEGAGADIYSEGELLSALQCKVNPDLISVNGGGKSDEMLNKCIEAGVRITVEDLDEPERINRIAKSLNKVAKIRFRVKPDFPNLWKKTDFALESASIDMGIQLYKSGIPAQYLPELGRQVLKMEHVEMTGIHFHGGRHSNSLWYWKGMMKRYAQLVVHLCNEWGGYVPEELDIGGGFATERDPHSKLGERENTIMTFFTYPFELAMYGLTVSGRYKAMSSMLEKVMSKMPGKVRAPSIEDYAEVSVTSFKDELLRGGLNLDGIRLQIEPGRSFFSNTGIHLTTVKKFKQQTQPMKMNWVLTDTTYFFLSGGIYEYNFHEFHVANKMNHPPKHMADIVGHSCYADRISPLVKVPDISEGDVIAYLDMGAYQEVSASNFNALPRPAMVLVNGKEAEIIKRAETIDDVFARDIIPKRLQQSAKVSDEEVSKSDKKKALENA
jgi:diaminopimelate decarboxylase